MDGEEQEAESIAMKVSAARFERQAQWKDFAILYRSNHQSRILEQALRNLKIPYTIAGGQSFFDKAEVRDILAYLRLLANDDDDPAFIRAATTPKRGIGQATLQTLASTPPAASCRCWPPCPRPAWKACWRRARSNRCAPSPNSSAACSGARAAARPMASAMRRQNRLARSWTICCKPSSTSGTCSSCSMRSRRRRAGRTMLELTGWLKRKAEEDNMSLFDLVQHVALVTMLERGEEEEPDAVKMSTLHASKGLEYPHVYLAGVEEGLLPHLGKDDEVGDPARAAENLATRIQEERRLMYVGITRAQRSLNLSWCKRRRRAREDVVREPSRFIEEMGLDDPPSRKTRSPRR